nr:aquaporin [Nannocystis sp.]
MPVFWAELTGTALLIVLGDGVVAGVLLRHSKSENAGWIVITIGWALAVTLAVYAVGSVSGGHLNPAVTLALASVGEFAWAQVPTYLLAQLLGAFLGACLVWLHYLPHWRATQDPASKLAVFCTAPALRHAPANFLSEALGSFILLFGLTAIGAHRFAEGLGPMVVGALVLAIGLSSAAPPATRSTPPATSAPASPTPCSRSPARAPRTGPTRGSPRSRRSSAPSLAPSPTARCSDASASPECPVPPHVASGARVYPRRPGESAMRRPWRRGPSPGWWQLC